MDSGLRKGMVTVLTANIINLMFNLLTNFLLPKYLSVDSYSAIKSFQLYVMYVGIFSMGCADGMYLRYGGKELKKLDKAELKSGLRTFRWLLAIESAILLCIVPFLHDKVLSAFVLTIMSLNMTSYFKNLYQAVGEFRKYGNILNLTTILTFAVNMLLLFFIGTDDYFLYLIGYGAVNALIWGLLEFHARSLFRDVSGSAGISFRLLCRDTRMGVTLMVGNFSSILLTSMDRWFVKAMMGSVQFAQYSFAVSLEGFLNAAITPITVTLYNYFCKHDDKETIKKSRKYVLMFSAVVIAAAFPAKFIVEHYLANYVEALPVLFILFGSQLFYISIKGIYVNLYKAKGKQAAYFTKLVLVLLIGALLNWLFVRIYPFKEAFAFGTLLSAAIWLILCVLDFKEYPLDIREILFALAEIAMFLLLGFYAGAVLGLLVYSILTAVCAYILFRRELCEALLAVKKAL